MTTTVYDAPQPPAPATTGARVRLRSVELFERPVTLRLPFRFGAATVTRCPQAFVRVVAEVDGRTAEGATAELMVPKWFDKNPELTHEQNFEQLRESLRNAADAYGSETSAQSPWQLAIQAGDVAVARGVARGLPRLVAQFGTAQLDKAVADAALRAAGLSWVAGLRAGLLGDPFSAALPLAAPARVALRHTVGLADRITEAELAAERDADPRDGLPASLESAITHDGLHHFKLKLSGRPDADTERLARIAALLDTRAGDYRVTLDGNETFASAAALGEFWAVFTARPELAGLLARTLLLEQPLPRAITLQESIAHLGIGVPVILDESDDHPGAFERGLSLGYRGISSKACKGIYRSLRSAARVAQEPERLLLSGEDLTCQAGLAVQQDCALASSLGVTHIERNGHHYVDGFGIAPEAESQAFAAAHPDLYRPGTRPRLAVRDGRIALASVHAAPGLGTAVHPRWDSLQTIRD
jgi:L-alanine-DL-glutamate epimerase-like enolase superfamily enzyme